MRPAPCLMRLPDPLRLPLQTRANAPTPKTQSPWRVMRPAMVLEPLLFVMEAVTPLPLIRKSLFQRLVVLKNWSAAPAAIVRFPSGSPMEVVVVSKLSKPCWTEMLPKAESTVTPPKKTWLLSLFVKLRDAPQLNKLD